MDIKEALGRSRRFEALHLSLPSSHGQVRVFCPVVRAFIVDMFSSKLSLWKLDQLRFSWHGSGHRSGHQSSNTRYPLRITRAGCQLNFRCVTAHSPRHVMPDSGGQIVQLIGRDIGFAANKHERRSGNESFSRSCFVNPPILHPDNLIGELLGLFMIMRCQNSCSAFP